MGDERMREGCGVYGVHLKRGEALPYLYWGLLAQNHRGHQSHGFAVYDGGIKVFKELGLIPPISHLSSKPEIGELSGGVGIGNVRYATSGACDEASLRRDAMPISISERGKSVAISLNGNIVNLKDLRGEFGNGGSDVHVICRILLEGIRETGSLEEGVKGCMERAEGAFSITGLTDEGTLFAFKDPYGFKPLCYGRGDGVEAFSSESVGLDINGIERVGEVQPGELLVVDGSSVHREQLVPCRRRAFCAFEFAYFARPDSIFDERYVYEVRRRFGVNLASRYSETASRCDIVISLPETSNDAAYGFHEESGLPWEMATRRHRYVTQRAFIMGAEERRNIVYRKVNILKPKIAGKRIAVVDDSIVRGDTTRSAVKRLREAGAKEIHLFITFPRIIGPCFYGIDMATYEELIGARLTPEKIAEELGADSVNYQPLEDYVEATGMRMNDLCLGCVTGEYPTPTANRLAKETRERISRGEREHGRIYETPD
ncbi:MAG: amidophosphoribosyltransferase [Candidatus Bathyarchaeia archaeon]|nr:amidophosphoribosyltransferase [Candidatus Bathyarchaeota archaeon]